MKKSGGGETQACPARCMCARLVAAACCGACACWARSAVCFFASRRRQSLSASFFSANDAEVEAVAALFCCMIDVPIRTDTPGPPNGVNQPSSASTTGASIAIADSVWNFLCT